MFEYLSITYLAFMNGEDEPYTQINDEYSKRLGEYFLVFIK